MESVCETAKSSEIPFLRVDDAKAVAGSVQLTFPLEWP